jgi:hypothetical protein
LSTISAEKDPPVSLLLYEKALPKRGDGHLQLNSSLKKGVQIHANEESYSFFFIHQSPGMNADINVILVAWYRICVGLLNLGWGL